MQTHISALVFIFKKFLVSNRFMAAVTKIVLSVLLDYSAELP